MDDQGTFSTFFRNAEMAASGVLDSVTDAFSGKASSLRDGTEYDPVELPRDLAAHSNAQTEWWYYTGHSVTEKGRRFGFELVFFKRRTDLDRFSFVPLRLLGNPFYFAHFAITDKDNSTFVYEHRKSANRQFDSPATASESHYHLTIGDWTAREAHGSHILRASIADKVTFEASFKPLKDVVLNGVGGVSFKDEGEASRYFSYTRMAAEGDIFIDGKLEHFTGTAWMDREFGTWHPTDNQKGWDWFSIQLDDDSELMVYQLRDEEGNPTRFSTGSLHRADGSVHKLGSEDFAIEATSKWKSPVSGAEYPSGWNISVPGSDMEIKVEPVMQDQELDTRGTTMIVYWEGACVVSGRSAGKTIGGNAYVELVGYDRSHERPDLSRFLLGDYADYFKF